jgi:hypothetical protein
VTKTVAGEWVARGEGDNLGLIFCYKLKYFHIQLSSHRTCIKTLDEKRKPARQVSDDIFTVQLVIFVHILLKGFVLRIEKGLLTLQHLGKF